MKKNKGTNFSALGLDPAKPGAEKTVIQVIDRTGVSDIQVSVPPKPKKKWVPNKKEFIPDTFVILYTLEGHTTWRVFNGFWSTWEAQKKNMHGTKITASRVFKLNRLSGEFYETPK